MSKLKKFLERRSESLAKDMSKKERSKPKELPVVEENLTDDEFWAITNQFMKESKNSNQDQIEILQTILEQYTPLKIQQFEKRYEELNK